MSSRAASIEDLVRQAGQAHTLRSLGFAFTDIGKRLGVSTATAWRRYWWWMQWGGPTLCGHDIGPLPVTRCITAPPGRLRMPRLDGPELMRLEPRPAVRCRARRRRDRHPCQAFAMHGGFVCRLHGGAAAQVRDAAAARHTSAKAAQILAGLGRAA